jgi:curved DNA-binding protein CbpA
MASTDTDVKTEPDWTSNDPYRILGLSRSAQLQDKDIKRAYRRLAMQYHPDVATTRDSSAEEKRLAADRFAKINAAYNTLLENKDAPRSSTASSTGWQPPHRRSGSSTSSAGRSQSRSRTDSFSTDWRDYIPKADDNEVYDTGGDSFAKILADLLQGASAVGAAGVGGGVGVFRDFVEFLEQNVDGYGKDSGDSDSELTFLLQTGSVQEIADEMDETELVVQQLSSKLDKVQNEYLQVQADLTVTDRRYSETSELRERSDELQAQKGVVENYLKRARGRLSKLQVRYKELIVRGASGSNSASRREPSARPPTGSYSADVQSSRSTSRSTAESTTAKKSPSPASSDEAWKGEGFGSFGGRSRGSSRRRSQQTQTPQSTTYDAPGSDTTQRSSSSEPYDNQRVPTNSAREAAVSNVDASSYVPPHRRNAAPRSFERTVDEEKRRLREIKVDEAFDQLKRDLGL